MCVHKRAKFQLWPTDLQITLIKKKKVILAIAIGSYILTQIYPEPQVK